MHRGRPPEARNQPVLNALELLCPWVVDVKRRGGIVTLQLTMPPGVQIGMPTLAVGEERRVVGDEIALGSGQRDQWNVETIMAENLHPELVDRRHATAADETTAQGTYAPMLRPPEPLHLEIPHESSPEVLLEKQLLEAELSHHQETCIHPLFEFACHT